jgi:hypothetical protein
VRDPFCLEEEVQTESKVTPHDPFAFALDHQLATDAACDSEKAGSHQDHRAGFGG